MLVIGRFTGRQIVLGVEHGNLVLLLLIVWLAPNTHQILGRFSPALARTDEARVRWLRWKPNSPWLGVLLVTLFFCLIHLHRETRFLYFQF